MVESDVGYRREEEARQDADIYGIKVICLRFRVTRQTNKQTNEQTNKQTNEQTDEQMN